jgi:uncharacterized short protein YbdD (DUF466 family)
MQIGASWCYNGQVSIATASSASGLRDLILRIGAVIRRIIGAPDYGRYLEHVRRVHPGQEPLTEKEFIRRQMEGRAKPGARCC